MPERKRGVFSSVAESYDAGQTGLRCDCCGNKLPPPKNFVGRPRKYCSDACAQAAYRRNKVGLAITAPRVKPGGRLRLIDRLGLRVGLLEKRPAL